MKPSSVMRGRSPPSMQLDLREIATRADPECVEVGAPRGALCVDGASGRVIVGVDETLHAFDLRDGARVQEYDLAPWELDPVDAWCHLLRVTPDGRHLVAALSMGNGGESWSHARVFDVVTGACVAELDAPDHLMTVSVDPAGELVVCTDPWSVQVHRVADGALVARSEDLPAARLAWHPITGDLVALEDGAMRTLDPRTLATRSRAVAARGVLPPMQSVGELHARGGVTSPVDAGCPRWAHDDLTLWADAPDAPLLWLSREGDAAVLRGESSVSRRRAKTSRFEVLLRLGEPGPGGWTDVAVSPDGAWLARRDGPVVMWRSLERASRRR